MQFWRLARNGISPPYFPTVPSSTRIKCEWLLSRHAPSDNRLEVMWYVTTPCVQNYTCFTLLSTFKFLGVSPQMGLINNTSTLFNVESEEDWRVVAQSPSLPLVLKTLNYVTLIKNPQATLYSYYSGRVNGTDLTVDQVCSVIHNTPGSNTNQMQLRCFVF